MELINITTDVKIKPEIVQSEKPLKCPQCKDYAAHFLYLYKNQWYCYNCVRINELPILKAVDNKRMKDMETFFLNGAKRIK